MALAWNASYIVGRITRRLRWNGKPYSSGDVFGHGRESHDTASIRMAFKRASELGGLTGNSV